LSEYHKWNNTCKETEQKINGVNDFAYQSNNV